MVPPLPDTERDADPSLVFIIGLHRSGTTFLYQTMADGLPVAAVRLVHVLCWRELSAPEGPSTLETLRAALNETFRARGISDRKIDRIHVSANTVEEYGWILRYAGGSMSLREATLPVFRELCSLVPRTGEPEGPLVLKNPWDTGRVAWLVTTFPSARFVFLSRDPEAILRSQVNAAVSYATEPHPFLGLLLAPIPRGWLYLAVHRWGRLLLGTVLFRAAVRVLLRASIRRELKKFSAALSAVPASRRFELAYEDLCTDPPGWLQRLREFLGTVPGDSPGRKS